MGFKGFIFVLLIALSVPIVYKRFVDDSMRKTIISYDGRIEIVDTKIRDLADKMHELKDEAISRLPPREVVQKEMASRFDSAVKFADEKIKISKRWVEAQIQEWMEGSASKGAAEKPKKDQPQKQQQQTTTTTTTSTTSTTRKPETKTERVAKCKDGDKEVKLWTNKELSQFDGKSGSSNKVYLAFLGLVYDVSLNKQHYGEGGEYNVFAGRDATRAFVTGNFTHDLSDKVDDLDDSLIGQIDTWKAFYRTSYPNLGRLVGNFYDSEGCPTEALKKVEQRLAAIEKSKEEEVRQDNAMPECNSEWNSDLKSGRVWCTTKSGGIERNWAGLPRLFEDDTSKRCVCYNADLAESETISKQLKLYPGCDPKASECTLI